jgi:diaminopimelate epimerase
MSKMMMMMKRLKKGKKKRTKKEKGPQSYKNNVDVVDEEFEHRLAFPCQHVDTTFIHVVVWVKEHDSLSFF